MPRSKPRTLERQVRKYMDSVLDGSRIAGQSEIKTLKRHVADLKKARHQGWVFDWDFAEIACEWFPQLTFPRGVAAGKPFNLRPAQKTLVSLLFGWRYKSTLLRRFRKAFISMARGNGKSPLAAGLASQLWLCDVPFQPGAEVVSVATTRKQSKEYVWIPACEFVRKLELDEYVKITKEEMEFRLNGTVGKFYPLGSDSANLDGGSYHAAVVDELHAMREKHRELMEKVESGMKGDNQLEIIITTAGNDRSVLWVPEYDLANKILNGVVEADTYFVYIFELDKEDDPFNERNWPKAHPLYNVAVKPADLRHHATQAKASPAKRNAFVRYYCNRMVTSRDKAVEPEQWAKGNAKLSKLDGHPCCGGLDLGFRDDLAAFAKVFSVDNPRDSAKPIYELTCKAWIAEGDGQSRSRDLTVPPWPQLIESGDVVVTDGDVTDHNVIMTEILADAEQYELQTVAADPHNARTMLTDLTQEGIATWPFRQNCDNYNEPFNRLLDLLAEGRIRHGGNKLLAWAADNVVVKSNSAGNIMPDKSRSIEKIDPFVAILMALSEVLFAERESTSIYEDQGVRIL